jgi:hypothetical protein
MLIVSRHYDEQVNVAVRVRRSVGVGAKENDLVGREALRNLSSITADYAHGHVGTPIGSLGQLGSFAGGHDFIIANAAMRSQIGGRAGCKTIRPGSTSATRSVPGATPPVRNNSGSRRLVCTR